MSMHTFEARKVVKLNELIKIKELLYEYAKKKKYRIYRDCDKEKIYNDISPNISATFWICDALLSIGIRMELSIISCYEYRESEGFSVPERVGCHCSVNYIVNPRRVLNDNEYIGIFDIKDTEKMIEKADRKIREVCSRLPLLSESAMFRLDYCANIFLDNGVLVERYLELMKKCRIPNHFNRLKLFNPNNRKHQYPKNGLGAESNSIRVNIYNKKAQLQKEMPYLNTIDQAEGLIRFEIQAKYPKLYAIKTKRGIRLLKDIINDSKKTSVELFSYYLPQFFLTGDYYNYEEAEALIRNCDYKNRMKEMMLIFLRLVSEKKGLQNAIDFMYEKEFTSAQVRYLLKRFNEINVNPVTIPRRWNLKETLPNPLKMVLGVNNKYD